MDLEIARSSLEEIDSIESSVADRISFNPSILPDFLPISNSSSLHGVPPRTLKDKVTHQLEVKFFLSRYEELSRGLADLESNSKSFGKSITFKRQDKRALMKHFYDRIEKIKAKEALYPRGVNVPFVELMKISSARRADDEVQPGLQSNKLLSDYTLQVEIDSLFSGEESYGRFVDLTQYYERFVNIKVLERQNLTYVQYLGQFADFSDYPAARLKSDEYRSYVMDLVNYLEGYLKRARPLDKPEQFVHITRDEAQSLWDKKEIPWYSEVVSEPKSELYCAACEKEFTNPAVYANHLTGRKHKNNEKRDTQKRDTAPQSEMAKAVVTTEYVVKSLKKLLQKTISDTMANVERRQVLTEKERKMELEALEEDYDEKVDPLEAFASDDEESAPVQQLPVDPNTGIPMPYWLWKLNGLKHEFNCEICGNTIYKGRKAFEKHFLEARHVTGLQGLGITPSAAFRDVTSIEEALQLWKKNQEMSGKSREASADVVVQMEDEDGNVMSQRVYNDLKRQGLL